MVNEGMGKSIDILGDDNSSLISDKLLLAQVGPLLESITLASFIVNPDGQRFVFSSGMTNVIGAVASQEMLLSALMQFVPVKDREYATDRYESAIHRLLHSKEKVIVFEHALRKTEDDVFWVKVFMQLVRIDGRCLISGVFVDRTQSMAERMVSQLLSEGIKEYVYYYDSVTDICYVNTQCMHLLDLATNYIENASSEIMHFIHPDDHTRFVTALENYLQRKNEFFVGDFRFLSPIKGEVWLHSCGASDYDIAGSMRYITGLMIDITERKRTDSIQKTIIDGSSAITYTADVKRGILRFSDNITSLLSDMKTEYTGDILKLVSDAIIPEDRKRFLQSVTKLVDREREKFSIEFRIVGSGGKPIWLATRGKVMVDTTKQNLVIAGTVFDLTSMNEVRENVEKSSNRHEITGLPVRGTLLSDTEKLIHDRKVLSAALLLVDVKDFHTYNDRYGRTTGDDILIAMAQMLTARLPEGGALYHIGVDAFCILWPHATRAKLDEYMLFLQDECSQPLIVGRGAFFMSLSMSAALFPSCGNIADELLVNAEITLHKVKQDKRKRYAIYSPLDKIELRERLDFEFQISKSIRSGHENFLLHFQPLVDAKNGKLVGAEALLRWISPTGEIVNPEKVIAALEATGQMEAFGSWIITSGIAQCSKWLKAGVSPDFYIHINVTAEDMAKIDYSATVIDLLKEYEVEPKNILLEITETSLMRNFAVCRQNLTKLRNAGIRIALDDFGTGYSSFNYLRELPVDEIKIDRAFVEDVLREKFNHSFISAIVLLAHSIGMSVCVEGIETLDKANVIRSLGADIFQGFYYSVPLDPKEFEKKYFPDLTQQNEN
ncbi:MAG TPA: EAL domain-containing protein [Bacillota bacterium]|nr:EAL domain-containing protein [Bacillota bacterium]